MESMDHLVLLQVRDKAVRASRNFINRGCRRYVEGGVIGVSPGQIGRLLGHDNRSQVMAGGIPNPYSPGTNDIQISLAIDLHTIGHPVLRSARLFAKDASVAQFAIVEVVDTDVLLGG